VILYLLDTCVVSEYAKPQPDASVANWLKTQDENSLYLSALTLGESKKGVEKLADGARKTRLRVDMIQGLLSRFEGRILPVDVEVCLRWGEMQAQLEKQGTPMPAIDGLIVATALHHQLTIVTRNTRDMEACGVALLNPWNE